MNYKRSFRALSDDDLRALLKESAELTFEAQLHLLEVVEEKRLPDHELIAELRQHIADEMILVDELKYLNHLGFSAQRESNGITVKRSTATRNIDIAGVLLGAVLGMNSFSAYAGVQQLINEELTGGAILSTTIYTALAVLGVLLISRCLGRLMEYKGFEIRQNGRELKVRKASFDQPVDPDHLSLEEEEGRLALIYSSGNSTVELIVTHGGVRAMQTLRSLHQQLILA